MRSVAQSTTIASTWPADTWPSRAKATARRSPSSALRRTVDRSWRILN